MEKEGKEGSEISRELDFNTTTARELILMARAVDVERCQSAALTFPVLIFCEYFEGFSDQALIIENDKSEIPLSHYTVSTWDFLMLYLRYSSYFLHLI